MNRRYNRIVAQSVRLIPCLICHVPEKPSHITRHMKAVHNIDGQFCCVWCLEYKCQPPRQTKDRKGFIEDYIHRLRCFEKRRQEAAVNKRTLHKDRPKLHIEEEIILERLKDQLCNWPNEFDVLKNVIAVNCFLESVSREKYSPKLDAELARLKILLSEQEKCRYLMLLNLIKTKK